jgi:transposase
MESTGSYWVPVYAVLEKAGCLELVVGNARHMKNVPGRKTDVKDSEWIADLLRHGLIRKSFVPPKPFRELRDLLRYRRGLVQMRSAECNRLLKVLETANIKLASVATDAFGVSGMLMIKALIEGRLTPTDMAQFARSSMRRKIPELELALRGDVQPHHRDMLRVQHARIEAANRDIATIDNHIRTRLEPYHAEMDLLVGIPGVDWVVAATLIAELGTDMSVFPSERHVSAWAGVCPGNNESAGKSKPTRSRKGNVHLKAVLVQAAFAASHAKRTYLRDKFHRLKARRGAGRAAIAIAHKILISAYQMLRTTTVFRELGPTYLDTRDKERVATNLVRRLEALGFTVTIETSAA